MNSDPLNRFEPIAIIGMGCLFPQADKPSAYWANICGRVDAITDVPPTHWRPEDYLDADPKAPDRVYAARGGFLSPVAFPPLDFGITPNTLEAIDTTQLLGMMVARQALEDAGYGAGRAFDRNRVSVILGVTGTLELVIPLGARLGHPIWRRALKEAGVADAVAQEVVQRISDSYVGWQEDSFPGLLGNVAAGRIANRLDLGGTNCVVDAACASSLAALHLAMLELQTGRADLALTGGLDTFNDIFMYMCFSKTPALSPTGSAKPFDAKGDGTILGEGLGVVLLKRHADAVRDGDRIYAIIRGLGTSSDGKGNAIYAPSPAGQAKALRQAYRTAGIGPETVELVEAHGTGTRAGDAAEATALAEVYRATGKPGAWCALGSVKSQIGHTKAAAGVAGLIKAALALHHKVLPPTIKVEQPVEVLAPGRSPFYVNTEARPWLPPAEHARRAAVSSFGFGGSNYHCVLEESAAAKPEVVWDDRVEVLAYSGQSREEVRDQVAGLATAAAWEAVQQEGRRTRVLFDHGHPVRLVLVVERDQPLPRILEKAQALLQGPLAPSGGPRSEKLFFGAGEAPGTLAFLFPGQGSQYVGMLRDWACRFPQVHEALEQAQFAQADGRRLSDFIYPAPTFSDAERNAQEEALRSTNVAQPAIGAVSVGGLRLLQQFGVRPSAVAGHSYGELVALHAAGVMEATTLHALSRMRGRLMDAAAGDRGGMLAVQATLPEVERVLADERLDLVIANRNAPRQFVLSGLKSEIGRAEQAFSGRKIGCRRLPVAAAFHSPLVDEVQRPFHETLEEARFQPGQVPVYANVTARPYPDQPAAMRTLLAEQLARPVAFTDVIGNMHAFGVRTFVEVGPSNKLSGLVRAILDGRPHTVLSLDASGGKRSACFDLACTLAELSALGHEVDWKQWSAGRAVPSADKKPTLTVAICGANYVKARTHGAAPNGTPKPKPAAIREEPPMRNGSQGEIEMRRNGEREPRSEPPAVVQPPHRAEAQSLPAPAAIQPAAPLSQALRMTQDNLVALQRLGEQTADLHRQFLDGQDKVLQAFQAVLEQQQRLIQGSMGTAAPVPTLPAPVPRPAAPITPPPAPARVAPVELVAAPLPAAEPEVPTMPAPPAVAGRGAKILLAVVSEKTGYPPEMLELDMELDADLGIDSIKRVEIFSALQERLPDAPVVKPEHLGTLRTLRNVVEFLGAAPVATSPQPVAAAPAAPAAPGAAGGQKEEATRVLLAVVSEKTGYPIEMLELDMEVDADLGIDSIKRVEIFSAIQERLPQAPVVKPEHLGSLRTLRDIGAFLGGSPGPQPAEAAPVAKPSPAVAPAQSGPLALTRLQLVYRELDEQSPRQPLSLGTDELWITEDGLGLAECLASRLGLLGHAVRRIAITDYQSLLRPETLAGLVIVAPVEADDAFLQHALRLVQFVAPALRQPREVGDSLLITVSRLDGAFGLASAVHATGGGLAGLVKTVRQEWPEVWCKALDVDARHADVEAAALAIIDEMLVADPLEVGIHAQGKTTLELREADIPVESKMPLAATDVVVITGGARGVTAEVALALANSVRPTLVLVGRSPAPAPEPAWLADLSQEAEIKRALLANGSGPLSPREVAAQYQAVVAQREVRANLERIAATGARVIYRSVDVRDAAAMRNLVAEIRSEWGPIRGLIHGAGVLADKRIEDKTAEQFERVYGTKVLGLRALFQVVPADELKLLVVFSSTTARYGRTGQVDYAMANEVLNKIAQVEARQRPGCKVVAVNWGPWDGGMVTPALKKLFAGEGVGLVPLQAGAEYLLREIASGASAVEVVVLGKSPDEPPITPAPLEAAVSVERELRLEDYPVLQAHVLDGHAVVPLALSMEWLAHAAMHANPGLSFHGFNDVRVHKGIRLLPGESVRVRLVAGKPAKQRDQFLVRAEVRGDLDGKEIVYSRADVVLTDRLSAAGPAREGPELQGYTRPVEEVYDAYLFHGPDLRGIDSIESCGAHGIVATAAAAPPPARWVRHPLRSNWLADPLVLDAAFQLLIVWSQEHRGLPSLPTFLKSYRQYCRSFPRDGVRIAAQVTQAQAHQARADIEFLDRDGKVVARIEQYECVLDASLREAFRRNSLDAAAAKHSEPSPQS